MSHGGHTSQGEGETPASHGYDWQQMVSYWTSRNRGAARVDYDRDPDGLANVCQSSIATVNRYYHRSQRRALLSLLQCLDPPVAGATALDVGCGAGRWCRLLAQLGYAVTGIDLQPGLVQTNRARDVHGVAYERSAVQDFHPHRSFDLVTSVTVLQHLPRHEQGVAADRIVGLLSPGGYLAILENISDRSSPVVHANSIAGWVNLFESRGLLLSHSQPYDYSPALRSYYALTRRLRERRQGDQDDSGGEARDDRHREFLVKADRGIRVAASMADSVMEPLAVRSGLSVPVGHCALLFRAGS